MPDDVVQRFLDNAIDRQFEGFRHFGLRLQSQLDLQRMTVAKVAGKLIKCAEKSVFGDGKRWQVCNDSTYRDQHRINQTAQAQEMLASRFSRPYGILLQQCQIDLHGCQQLTEVIMHFLRQAALFTVTQSIEGSNHDIPQRRLLASPVQDL